jgi:hypothetical protein
LTGCSGEHPPQIEATPDSPQRRKEAWFARVSAGILVVTALAKLGSLGGVTSIRSRNGSASPRQLPPLLNSPHATSRTILILTTFITVTIVVAFDADGGADV